MKKYSFSKAAAVTSLSVGLLALSPVANAATTSNSQLTQTVNAGVISTDFRDSSNALVANPTFGLSAATVQSTGYATTTGTFGTDSQRISVDNPGASTSGSWTLSLAATGGTSSTWTNGTNTYPYNSTAAAGQMTVDPSVGTITANTGGLTGVTKGTSSAFNGSTTTAITLMSASSASSVWNGYLTGVSIAQTIPAGTPAGSYTFNLTQTATAS